MRLWCSPTSPYSRKVRIVLREKRIPCVELNPAEKGISLLEKNPLSKIPTLEIEDWSTLYDSVVIVEYLEALAPEPALIPKDALARARVRTWEALADGIADAVIFGVLEARRAPEHQDASFVQKQHFKVRAAFLALATELNAKGALAGAEFSLADAAALAALGYVELRAPELLEAAPPEIAAYRARHAARPSVAQTTPDSPLLALNG